MLNKVFIQKWSLSTRVRFTALVIPTWEIMWTPWLWTQYTMVMNSVHYYFNDGDRWKVDFKIRFKKASVKISSCSISFDPNSHGNPTPNHNVVLVCETRGYKHHKTLPRASIFKYYLNCTMLKFVFTTLCPINWTTIPIWTLRLFFQTYAYPYHANFGSRLNLKHCKFWDFIIACWWRF